MNIIIDLPKEILTAAAFEGIQANRSRKKQLEYIIQSHFTGLQPELKPTETQPVKPKAIPKTQKEANPKPDKINFWSDYRKQT